MSAFVRARSRAALLVGVAFLTSSRLVHAAESAAAATSASEDAGAAVIASIEAWQQALFARTASAVVFIKAGDRLGSGFFVDGGGLILTNAHLVGGARVVKIVLLDGTTLDGRVVEMAADRVDLALVQVDRAGTPALHAADELRVGSWVGSVGHGAGAVWTFNTGMISNIYSEKQGEQPVFQTEMPLNPGSSGGPVLDRRGRVLGITTAGVAQAQGVNFAIRISLARKVLKRFPRDCDCLSVSAPAGALVFLDGRLVGRGPVVEVTVSAGRHAVTVTEGDDRQSQHVDYPTVRALRFVRPR